MSHKYKPVPGVPDAVRNYFKMNGSRGGRTVTARKLEALARVRARKRIKPQRGLEVVTIVEAASTGTGQASESVVTVSEES